MTRIPRIQYHATSMDRLKSVMAKGLSLPRAGRDVSTHWYKIPTISTADKPDDARVYHPHGVLIKVKVKSGAKYLSRSIRSMRKGENLEQSVNRWIQEAKNANADGVRVEGLQSTVGNQTINPRVLEVVGIVDDQLSDKKNGGSMNDILEELESILEAKTAHGGKRISKPRPPDAYVRHAVVAINKKKKHGKSVGIDGAHAIARHQGVKGKGPKLPYYKKGKRHTQTVSGKKHIRRHRREKGRSEKDAAYKKMVGRRAPEFTGSFHVEDAGTMKSLIQRLQSIMESDGPRVVKLPPSTKHVSISRKTRGGVPSGKMVTKRWAAVLAKMIDKAAGFKLPWEETSDGVSAATMSVNIAIYAYRKGISLRIGFNDGKTYMADGLVFGKGEKVPESVHALRVMADMEQLIEREKNGKRFPLDRIRRMFRNVPQPRIKK